MKAGSLTALQFTPLKMWCVLEGNQGGRQMIGECGEKHWKEKQTSPITSLPLLLGVDE